MSGAVADKRIQIRVVNYDRGGGRTNYAWYAHTINERHTVQAAVQ